MSESKQDNDNKDSKEVVQELEPQVLGFEPEFDDEKDILFQTQMKVHQLLMAQWKNLLSIVVVFLVGVLIYGTWSNKVVEEQRSYHSDLAKIQKRLPNALATGATTAQKSKFRSSAAEAESIAKSATGVGATYSWIEAGKMWLVAEEWDAAIAAFSNIDNTAPELLQWTAISQISQAYVKKGDSSKAVENIQSKLDFR